MVVEIRNYLTRNKKAVLVALFLADIYALNAVYNLWTAPQSTPIWKSAATIHISKLVQTVKNRPILKFLMDKQGMITGILYSAQNPSVLIDGKIVYQGQTVHSVKVVKIHLDRVEFERAGKKWTQKVNEPPDPAWE